MPSICDDMRASFKASMAMKGSTLGVSCALTSNSLIQPVALTNKATMREESSRGGLGGKGAGQKASYESSLGPLFTPMLCRL